MMYPEPKRAAEPGKVEPWEYTRFPWLPDMNMLLNSVSVVQSIFDKLVYLLASS